MKKTFVLLAVVLVAVLAFSELKIGFIYLTTPGDGGWSYAHEQGRLYIEKVFGSSISTTYIENVPEGMESLNTIESLAKRGFNVIFTTSFGYMDPTFLAAEKYPNILFFHCSGYLTTANMTAYFGRIEEPRFLSGMVAGMMTKSNKLGYVAAHPIPEVVRGINAFALGAKLVNPEAKVHVIWSNSWYDPAKEKEAALSLLSIGCDVITQHQDSPAAQQAAQEKGAFSIGYNTDMKQFAPKAYLTSPIWNWGVYYEKAIKAILAGNYKSESYWKGLDDGIVDLAPLSDLVPENVKTVVGIFKTAILNKAFNIFQGTIKDQKGVVKAKLGEIVSDDELLSMNWFVDNVVGVIPQSN